VKWISTNIMKWQSFGCKTPTHFFQKDLVVDLADCRIVVFKTPYEKAHFYKIFWTNSKIGVHFKYSKLAPKDSRLKLHPNASS